MQMMPSSTTWHKHLAWSKRAHRKMSNLSINGFNKLQHQEAMRARYVYAYLKHREF